MSGAAASAGDVTALRVDVDLTPADHAALVRFLTRRAIAETRGPHSRRNRFLAACALGVPIGLAWTLTGSRFRFDIHWPTVGLVVAIVAVVGVIFCISFVRNMRGLAPAADGTVLGRQTFTLLAEGIRLESLRCEALMRWSAVRSVDEGPEHVFFRVDTCAGFVLPKRFLRGDVTAAAIVAEAREHLHA